MTKQEIQRLQKEVNKTLKSAELDWLHLVVDGDLGPTTFKLARLAGSWQGLSKEQLKDIGNRKISDHVYAILVHGKPRTKQMESRARDRRGNFRKMREEHRKPPEDADGVSTWRGFNVASWMVGERKGPDGRQVNWLQKSVDNGWNGQLNSGWRSPAYSESLCMNMCGAPSCPGMCAGRASNHSQIGPPNWGAIDVQEYVKFGQIQKEIGSPMFNALGPADPVHFSPTGR